MSTSIRLAVGLTSLAFLLSGGINWREIWMEPNPIILPSPGSSIPYVVKGIHGMSNAHDDLTHNQYLKITSSDENVIAVDQKSARLIGRHVGDAEIRIAFSECTSINHAKVMSFGKAEPNPSTEH